MFQKMEGEDVHGAGSLFVAWRLGPVLQFFERRYVAVDSCNVCKYAISGGEFNFTILGNSCWSCGA